MGYGRLNGRPDHDRDLVYHHGMLKKVKRGINEIMCM